MQIIPVYRCLGCRRRAATLCGILLLLSACDSPGSITAAETAYSCDPNGMLRTELYGAIRENIEWRANQLACEGMPRPNSEGARLRLSGPLGDKTLAIILGLPDLGRGETGMEFPTNVTFIEEGSGRFFSTTDTSGCWTDIDIHEPAVAQSVSNYRIGGTLYCVSPLPELNGGSSISFTKLAFVGRLDWEPLQ